MLKNELKTLQPAMFGDKFLISSGYFLRKINFYLFIFGIVLRRISDSREINQDGMRSNSKKDLLETTI